MSASNIGLLSFFQPVLVQTRETRLTLSPEHVRIHRNGVEFRSSVPINAWTELTMTLQSTRDAGRVNCTGVVVASNGNRHNGYMVSVVFTSLSKQSQARLNLLALP